MGFTTSVTADPVSPGTAAGGSAWLGVSRRRASRLAWLALAAMLVGAAAFLFHQTRGTTFWFDEWGWALYRRDDGLGTFLEPHNSHLSLVPLAIYKLLLATAGLTDYTPYRAVVIGVHLLCSTLVFVYAKRRVGPFLGLLPAALILFLGPAAQNIVWPFQIAWLISLTAGLGALLMLDRDDRRGDVAACALLALSLASSGLGVPVALGLLVDVLWGRRRPRDAWIVAGPIALYALWWLVYQESNWVGVAKGAGIQNPQLTGILNAPEFAANSAASALSALTGLGGQTGLAGAGSGTFLEWGAPLALAATAVLLWRVARLGSIPPRVLTLLAIVLSFWLLTAYTRGFISVPYTSRYLYVGGLFVALAVVELARDVSISPRTSMLLAAAVAAAVVSNVGMLRDSARYYRSQAGLTRAQVSALEITRPIVKPLFVVNKPFFIIARPYFSAAEEFGSAGLTPAEIAGEPEDVRRTTDTQLIRSHELDLRPSPPAVRFGSRPTVEAVAGGKAAGRGACVRFEPDAFLPPVAVKQIDVAVPPAGLRVTTEGGPATVSVRRFADEFQPLPSKLTASASAILRVRPDLAPQPWHMRVAATERATVCALRAGRAR